MRLTFIHDHKFIEFEGRFYSTGKFNQRILNQYKVGTIDNIQVIGRLQNNKYKIDSLSKVSAKTIKVKPIKFLKKKSDFFFKKRCIYKFIKQNINNDEIIIVRLPSELGYIALKYLQKKDMKYGIEIVGDPWDALWYHGSLIGKAMAFINRRKTKKALKKSKNNIYVTKYYLQNKYPSKGKNFNASNVFLTKHQNNYELKNRIIFKIGMVASLDTKYKGIDTALKSLRKLQNENIILEIVGNGPKEKWNKKIKEMNLENQVILKGTLKGGDPIYQWMMDLDLYIQPSYTEGLPRALIEAMANGLPSLASNVGGIPELLEKKFMHKAKDYKTLAQQIIMVKNNKEFRRKMSNDNFKVSKNYQKEKIEKERILFIKSIMGE